MALRPIIAQAHQQLARLGKDLQRHVAFAQSVLFRSSSSWMDETQQPGAATQQQHAALHAAVTLLAAACLQLGGAVGAAQAFNLASVAEDQLLQFVRQVEVRVGSAVEAARDSLPVRSTPPAACFCGLVHCPLPVPTLCATA